jgi:hypothetical protein
MNLKLDTLVIDINDSSYKDSRSQITLINGNNKELNNLWYDNNLISSVIFPLIVAVITAFILNKINAKKNKAELKKLIAETEVLQKSFQPLVFSAIQSIQEKLLEKRLKALKIIIGISNNINSFDPMYSEEDGEPYYPNEQERIEILFKTFSREYYEDFNNFHLEHSYLFPESLLERNSQILNRLRKILDDNHGFWDVYEGNPKVTVGKKTADYLNETLGMIEKSIFQIRQECHIDSTYVREFIEQSKTK